MKTTVLLPDNFTDYLLIDNAEQRFSEARMVAEKIQAAGVSLMRNLDHAAIFCDPPRLVSGPLKAIGYVKGWDMRCYPSPVDECDYINISARLDQQTVAWQQGWFEYVAIVHPVDQEAHDNMMGQGYGNPCIHHLTWGIVPPERRTEEDDLAYANRLIPFMIDVRQRIGAAISDDPGTLIVALPPHMVADPSFDQVCSQWFANIPSDDYQVESMQGGGFLIQFFVLTGGRIEVALRSNTQQTFNPKSVHKISEDEISTTQGE